MYEFSGFLEKMWINNCVAVGLSSSFVEPLEATSIGSTILQANCLVENLGTFKPGQTFQQKSFNNKMASMMENILCMISLHYVSDRKDTDFWKDVSSARKPEYLDYLIGLWSERPMFQGDIKRNGYEMFLEPHFFHVAHGQGLINMEQARQMLVSFNLESEAKKLVSNAKLNQIDHERVDHGQALREIQI
jgi:tryptophan halogenase